MDKRREFGMNETLLKWSCPFPVSLPVWAGALSYTLELTIWVIIESQGCYVDGPWKVHANLLSKCVHPDMFDEINICVELGMKEWVSSLLLFFLTAKGSRTDPPVWGVLEGQPNRERLLWPWVSEHADELGMYSRTHLSLYVKTWWTNDVTCIRLLLRFLQQTKPNSNLNFQTKS